MKSLILLSSLVFSLALCQSTRKEAPESYIIETIPMPEGLTAEVAALEFLPDGRLVAAFMRGEIMIFDPQKKEWKLFATGLQEPLGMLVVDENELLVMQLPELTRIKDTDGDGLADSYETVYDGFGMTGNYHEFTYGPVKDKQGNLYIALNSSSSGGGIAEEVRGELNMDGKGQGRAMFSVVPYRGWVIKITPQGEVVPFASGFRSPNGLLIDDHNRLLVTDNQGDWVGSSHLYHVEEGGFYGHPASLVWDKNWHNGNPFEWPVDSLNNLREKPTVIFPHNVIANSPTQPLVIREGMHMDHFKGQLIVGEMNTERLVRVMLEEVNGVVQGAVTPFIDGQGLRKGNNRLAIAPDGSLWVGQSDHGWLGDRGIQKITATNKVPFDVKDIKLDKDGFDLTFTKGFSVPKGTDLSSWLKIKKYHYHYHAKYGSDRVDEQEVVVKGFKPKAGNTTLSLQLDEVNEGSIYEITIDTLLAKGQQDTLTNKIVAYTVKKAR
ncbi:hypothetical protein G5B00_15940 [Parapedobacter sp. SGR-10]|uniref:PQQ-dependent sugar dehydrogenase n=1 Tax=Parapedobacter sp. SGR-10 TaxID=2710879 RepID=UPI0013D6D43E|nr:PQQ-dependent sugar dehydrogenase [Parapedobacter sp. SGR-10]NGF58008.1 hypothetical protein [Parapedobacter sp. SGR-10]